MASPERNTVNGSVAIVTGASRGIGRAIAEALAMNGGSVVCAARDRSALEKMVSAMSANGSAAMAIPTDVTSETSVTEMVQKTIRSFGRIDILVNNAGVGWFGNVADMPAVEYERVMNVNMKGVFLCCRAVLPAMIGQKHGEIINIASLAGKNPTAGSAAYSASKWGLIGFSRSLMLEVREHNIRVVTIAPGSVNTAFRDGERSDPNIIQPDDVASAVLYALTAPGRINVSEIDVRPTIKPKR